MLSWNQLCSRDKNESLQPFCYDTFSCRRCPHGTYFLPAYQYFLEITKSYSTENLQLLIVHFVLYLNILYKQWSSSWGLTSFLLRSRFFLIFESMRLYRQMSKHLIAWQSTIQSYLTNLFLSSPLASLTQTHLFHFHTIYSLRSSDTNIEDSSIKS